MATKTYPSFVGMTPSGDVALGRIQLAPEVLEVIVGIATTEVEGVVATQGNFATGVAEKLGRVMYGKGVKMEWADEGLKIDVYCIVEYGHSIPAVAAEIQREIRQAIFHMTSLATHEVNVHVTGIRFDE
ncbi:Asp23/Gls24 family envelope stress response protein [Sporosarcina sp. PTS2304]|uniref:Asp23/Gls24 family envelope stress response protein n=1 Tax=Sporosarcina sp. PTS2304 TaxID=2283194 RepID=UPI000E0DE323|nr:Asp23/Gls24 family envelope stress response protein [Sporosarcina sp. PTS2304]AXH99066.1 Asp23/Gls24 family envelope stress response protein [Sporosarcina sp. PTS2304]